MPARALAFKWLQHPASAAAVLVLAMVLHIAFALVDDFYTDDYLHGLVMSGNQEIIDKGLLPDTSGFFDKLSHQFYFFHPGSDAYLAQKEYGVLPWWVQDDASLHLWRPLASFTHWLDYQLWPDSIAMMHLQGLVFLLLAYIAWYRCYQHILKEQAVVVIAMLVLVLDVSSIPPLTWIAARNSLMVLLFASLALLYFHKAFNAGLSSVKSSVSYILSILFLVAALLSAEAGVVVMFFLLAYLFFFTSLTFSGKALHTGIVLLPVIVWRVYYQSNAYGASGIGHYLDPLGESLAFMANALLQYPVLLIQVITGAEALDLVFRGLLKPLLAIVAFFLFFWLIAVMKFLQLWERQGGFWLLILLLSLLPMTSLTLSDTRLTLLSFCAYAALLSLMFYRYFNCQDSPLFVTLFVNLSILGHIIIPLVIFVTSSLVSITGASFNTEKENLRYNMFNDFEDVDRHVLIVNSVDPFLSMFYVYRQVFRGEPVAKSVRQLLMAEHPVSLERLSENRLRLTQQGGMPIYPPDQESLLQPKLVTSMEGIHHLFAGFFHNGDYRYKNGQSYYFKEVVISIESLDDAGRPQTIMVELNVTAMEDMTWLVWDWSRKQYRQVKLPAIGETMELQGRHENS